MRVVCLTREGREYSRAMQDFVEDLRRKCGLAPEVILADSAEGEGMMRSLGLMMVPTIVAIDQRGSVKEVWRGMPLPRLVEVEYYLQEGNETRRDGDLTLGKEIEDSGGGERTIKREGKKLEPIKKETK